MACAVSGLSPVIITVRMPIARSWAKRSAHARLDHVLQVHDARATRPQPWPMRSATTSGVPPEAEISSTMA